MKNRPEIDIEKTLENLEIPQVSMPGHKKQLKMMLLAQGSLESQKTGGFISSVLNKTFEVILLKKKALIIAVPVMLLLLAVFTYQALTLRPQGVAAVTLQVNPALTLTLDNKNIVLEAEGENAEGEVVVADYPVKGKELKEALEDLTMHLHDKGFLRPDSEVIITVHPIDGLDQEKLSSLSDFAQQIMSESLNRYNVQKPDSFVISHGLHLFLKELDLMPLDYAELLKANLTEEEIIKVINALGRKDTSVALLPYIEFNLEIESDERELSVEFKQKSYGIYAEVEFEEDGKKDIELESKAALDYLLPILEKLEIDASMSKQAIVERVLTAFGWTFPYEEFEIEVKFADGSYIDFEWESAKNYIETTAPAQATMLSASEARKMVISRFGGIIQKIEYAYDDTHPMYKGEALKAGYKVVFEINARTKNWVKWDTSKEDSWDDFGHALPNMITMDQAADSAIGKSGHSGTFIQKIDFLWDDAEPLYQGEAYHKGIKYSFEIYAYGGNYQKWDIDTDDDTWEEKYYNVR